MDLLLLLFSAIWYILPAYVANAVPCILGGGRPVDLGKNFFDGNRIIGNGVTYRGTFFGILFGIITGILQHFIVILYMDPQSVFNYGLTGYIILGFLLGTGALFGDMLGSFIKRRLKLNQGQSAPLLDQMTFIVFALIFAYPLYQQPVNLMVILLVISPIIHFSSNIIAYKLHLKKVWW
ncbi:CDP-2,3-bis-(O-geranylgeranyl)-sn-glycerol synthase [Methanococcus maripaludis]|uniref:CDP-archaeol synthase n=2 Tax=Methanococcus maripaludis TaxID=39152 RepID=CDPAS_METM7|nr:CDP-2,3-bis-(O-geranylgeranyl)-sn-glycerol synthase [Methanococcus maripaludis]A6VHW4.1 RecName: Full=CDP-archaeol synthase; AltName: Full=CDP-2,3-bis-(O-geranylgeranyl)-sn-glycerol synthase [Methanococcus maripaludis C7]MBA2861703.1 CDP-2,3-bis-(O-geranylgeranyl)-sn-glycerol synthase [Methanococcus maripaludis]